jgi:hypothetical protein
MTRFNDLLKENKHVHVVILFCSKNIVNIVTNFTVMSEVKSCELSRIGGGCPDLSKCMKTCLPCYVGIGEIHYYCRHPGGPILYETCVCVMVKGAPCQVRGCPGNTPPAAVVSNYNQTQYMKYLNNTA